MHAADRRSRLPNGSSVLGPGIGWLRVTRIHQAVCRFRRRVWWGVLESRPQGFPWLRAAGRELTGTTVIDLEARVVLASSDKNEKRESDHNHGLNYGTVPAGHP